jgi:hypothetical protein
LNIYSFVGLILLIGIVKERHHANRLAWKPNVEGRSPDAIYQAADPLGPL